MIYCPKCETEKQDEAFADDSYRSSGKQTYCRECYAFLVRWGKAQKQIKAQLRLSNIKREVDDYNVKNRISEERLLSFKLIDKKRGWREDTY